MSKKIIEGSKNSVKVSNESKYQFIFQLFVTGILPNSTRAIINFKAFCEMHLKSRYKLDVIDIYQQPALAHTEDIIAIPTLVRKYPLPEIRVVGDLSDSENVLKALLVK